ncbi:hypothetical protein D3C80_1457280 [compost metagenome]
MQGLAQLLLTAQGGQRGDLVERAQGLLLALQVLLGLLALHVAAQCLDQLAEGGEQGLQLFGQGLRITAGAVGQAEHADQAAMGMDGQAGKRQQRRMPRG